MGISEETLSCSSPQAFLCLYQKDGAQAAWLFCQGLGSPVKKVGSFQTQPCIWLTGLQGESRWKAPQGFSSGEPYFQCYPKNMTAPRSCLHSWSQGLEGSSLGAETPASLPPQEPSYHHGLGLLMVTCPACPLSHVGEPQSIPGESWPLSLPKPGKGHPNAF